MRLWLITLVFVSGVVACSGPFDSSTQPAVGPDGDAGLDGALPDVVIMDSSMTDGADAAPVDADAAPTPCTCVPTSSCVTASCDAQGACVQTPVADGTACGETSQTICITGVCSMRVCGDGYLEPGPTPVSREMCDDGNMTSGDGCSAMCEPEIIVVDASMSNAYAARPLGRPAAVGVDGTGALLFVGTRDRFVSTDIVARRATARGTFVPTATEDFIVLETGLPGVQSASPVVVGLPIGWVVVWSAPRVGTHDIIAQRVNADGTKGVQVVVNVQRTSTQGDPAVTVLANELVIGWTDAFVSTDDPFGGIRARRFTHSLVPIGGEIVLASSRGHSEQALSLASLGSTWVAAWGRRGGSLATPQIALRRFSQSTPLDESEISFPGAAGNEHAVIGAAPAYGIFGMLYRSFANDAFGDIRMAAFSPSNFSTWSPATLSAMPGIREAFPAGASSPGNGEAVQVFEIGTPPRLHIMKATMVGPSLLPVVAAAFDEGGVDSASIVAGPRGFWVTWSGTLADLGSDQAFLAYLLPYGAPQ